MFDKSTWIRLPRAVVVGHGVLDEVVEAADEAGLTGDPLVVAGETPWTVAGEQVADAFADAGREPAHVVVDEAGIDAVDQTVDAARDAEADYLIGVGGGTPIDVAKLAGDRLDLGFVSVPTAASHDGIVSGRGSIPEGDSRHSVAARPPLAVVADTGVIADAPWRLTTAGCADIISNSTAVMDWRLAHRLRDVEYSEYAGSLSEMTAEMLVENAGEIKPGLEESAWIVVKALVSSGVAMSIAGSSRPASGAEHLFSHQLDRMVPNAALHGHQVGVGAIVTAYLQGGEQGRWQAVRDALTAIDAPTTAADLGVEAETVVEALLSAHEIRDRYTILGDGISEPAAREALRRTGVVDES
jgi:glycerol-1-phosphate dehydrogenase [NAD(P)+]